MARHLWDVGNPLISLAQSHSAYLSNDWIRHVIDMSGKSLHYRMILCMQLTSSNYQYQYSPRLQGFLLYIEALHRLVQHF